jgi:hypothetical protein
MLALMMLQVDVHPRTNPSAPSTTLLVQQCIAGMPLIGRDSLLGLVCHISIAAAHDHINHARLIGTRTYASAPLASVVTVVLCWWELARVPALLKLL